VSRSGRRIAAGLLGLAGALLAVELLLRAGGLRADTFDLGDLTSFDRAAYEAELNSLGFHDHEWTLAKEPGVQRVLVLGDSFTEGAKVDRDRLFVKVAEASLKARVPGGVQLFNMSRGGWDTADEVGWLRAALSEGFDPDAVLIVFFPNDVSTRSSNDTIVKEWVEEVSMRKGWLNRASVLYDWIDFARRRRAVTRRTMEDYLTSIREDGKERWAEFEAALGEAAELCRERDLRLGLLVFPVLVQLDDEHALEPVYAEVLAACEELSVPARSLLPVFAGREAATLWCDPWDAHPNAEANALVAPAVEDFLVESGLVRTP